VELAVFINTLLHKRSKSQIDPIIKAHTTELKFGLSQLSQPRPHTKLIAFSLGIMKADAGENSTE